MGFQFKRLPKTEMDLDPFLTKCTRHLSDLTAAIQRLQTHLKPDDCLFLRSATENIVDRQKDKQRFKRQWKVVLYTKIPIATPIQYDEILE